MNLLWRLIDKLPGAQRIAGPDEDQRFRRTMFVVEADSFSVHQLWKENHESHDWRQDCSGLWLAIGRYHGTPLYASFQWATIDGQLVLFYEPTSALQHYWILDRWLERHCNPRWDRGTRRAHCDAMNFHHCLDAIREANAAKEVARV